MPVTVRLVALMPVFGNAPIAGRAPASLWTFELAEARWFGRRPCEPPASGGEQAGDEAAARERICSALRGPSYHDCDRQEHPVLNVFYTTPDACPADPLLKRIHGTRAT